MNRKPSGIVLVDKISAFVGLGSNIGDSEEILRQACVVLQDTRALEKQFPSIRGASITLEAVSSVYRTAPQLYVDQPFFYNQVAQLICSSMLLPEHLLAHLLAVEAQLGRTREGPRFGPRVIDLDLLLFGEVCLSSPTLELPHPRMLERAFVLVPLAEIAPDLLLPCGMAVKNALQHLSYSQAGHTILQ